MPGATIATTLTATKPSDWLIGGLGFALMVAYWPGISGVATTPRWDVAALLAVALFFAPRVKMSAPHWLGLCLIGWLVLSLLWNDGGSDGRLDGVNHCVELGTAAIAFGVGSVALRDIDALLIGSAVGLGINSLIAIAQVSGVLDPHGLIHALDGGSAGLFYNKDRLGAVAAMVAVGLIAFPKLRQLLWLVLPALLLSGSRAAWLGALFGAAIVCWRSLGLADRFYWGVICAVLGGFYMAIYGVGHSASERFDIWRDTIANLNFFGHGLGAFREDFLRLAKSYDFVLYNSRPEHPHNEILWIAFEGGIPGLALAIGFAAGVWRAVRSYPERAMLACLFVLAQFAMPLHDPATVVLGALVAGSLVGRRDRFCHVAVDGGTELCPRLAAVVDR